jgi:hypothetical protein
MAAQPEAGMAFAALIVNFDDRSEFLRSFVHAWAAVDPQSALTYADQQPPGLFKTDCLAAACGGWATTNPEAAAAWAKTSTTGPTKTKSLARIAESWAAKAPQEAAMWASSLPAGIQHLGQSRPQRGRRLDHRPARRPSTRRSPPATGR